MEDHCGICKSELKVNRGSSKHEKYCPVCDYPKSAIDGERLFDSRHLRYARYSAGLTVGEAARRSGLSETAISGAERRKSTRVVTAAVLLDVYGFEIILRRKGGD